MGRNGELVFYGTLFSKGCHEWCVVRSCVSGKKRYNRNWQVVWKARLSPGTFSASCSRQTAARRFAFLRRISVFLQASENSNSECQGPVCQDRCVCAVRGLLPDSDVPGMVGTGGSSTSLQCWSAYFNDTMLLNHYYHFYFLLFRVYGWMFELGSYLGVGRPPFRAWGVHFTIPL